MKYDELKNALKNKIENAYLIFGEDRYLCFDALKKIESSLGIMIKDMNSVTISGEGASAREIVDCANVYPFGDTYRFVLVKNFAPSKNKEETKIIQDYLSSPQSTTVLVFFNPENADFFKGMSHITPVDCGKIDTKFIVAYIKNVLAKNEVSSSEGAINKLIEYSLEDMTKITNELEKLISYVADTKVLTADIVEEFVVQDKEYQIYELAVFLAKGESEKAIDLIDNFMIKPGSAFTILSPLFNNYRRALFVSINSAKSPSELASLLGIQEFAVKKLKQQTEIFTPKQLKQIVDMIADYDRKIKVGEIKENVAIKTIAINILNMRG